MYIVIYTRYVRRRLPSKRADPKRFSVKKAPRSYERGAFFSSKAGESAGSASEQAEDQDGVPLQVQHPAHESDVVVF